jgi:hypothetical protein
MTDRLKYGDIVEWETDGHLVRWMIVSANPKYLTQYVAAWMVAPDGSNWPHQVGDIQTIGILNDDPKVTRA